MKLDLSMLETRAPRARAAEAADMPVLSGCALDAGSFALPDVEDVSFSTVVLSSVFLLFPWRGHARPLLSVCARARDGPSIDRTFFSQHPAAVAITSLAHKNINSKNHRSTLSSARSSSSSSRATAPPRSASSSRAA